MERDAGKPIDDALQRRLARFVAEVKSPRSVGGSEGVCIGTNLGAVREHNEDRALVALASYKSEPQRNFMLAALCDGIGGLTKGGDAAVLAISVFVSRFLRTPRVPSSERLHGAAMAANAAVYRMLSGRGGTTLSAVFINGNGQAVNVNVGDSRVYSISDSRQLVQLSRDDTIAEALGNRDATKHQTQLLQFLGMGEGVEPHIFATHSAQSAFLLTSDGIHGAPREALAQVVRNARTDMEVVQRLLDLSDALGGHDNSTALFVPIRVAAPEADHEQGLNLRFWSASDRLEIWIPILADELRQERLPSALAEARDVELKERSDMYSKQPGDQSRRRSRRRSGKKTDKANTLPLNEAERPPLDIRFPEKD
jgi:PPM family protein phosphatase